MGVLSRILQADVDRTELRRRGHPRRQAANLNDLKAMVERVSDADKCSIVGC